MKVLQRTIKATANHSKRTFTIRTGTAKYRTIQMTRSDFEANLNNTANDWENYLQHEDYYKV